MQLVNEDLKYWDEQDTGNGRYVRNMGKWLKGIIDNDIQEFLLRIQLIKNQARILEKHMIKLRCKTNPNRQEQLVEMEMIEELKHLMDDLEEQRKNYKLSDKNRKTMVQSQDLAREELENLMHNPISIEDRNLVNIIKIKTLINPSKNTERVYGKCGNCKK
jgi:hypothetical protein